MASTLNYQQPPASIDLSAFQGMNLPWADLLAQADDEDLALLQSLSQQPGNAVRRLPPVGGQFAPNYEGIGYGQSASESFAPNSADTLAALQQQPVAPSNDILPISQLFGPPDYLATGEMQPQPGQSPGIGDKLSSFLSSLSQPQGSQYGGGLPQPSDLQTLVGLGAALAGGGGASGIIGTAADLSNFNQVRAIQEAQLGQQFQRRQQAIENDSPAGQMRRTQQQFYAQRMSSDVNRYVDMISNDVNGMIPDIERERIWGQLVAKYQPLGLNPGPSPSQVQQWTAEEASPEFRNKKLVETFRGSYGEAAADVVGAMLQGGVSPDKVAEFQVRLETVRAQERATEQRARDEAVKVIHKQIEVERKRDLEIHRNAGIQGLQVTKDNTGMLSNKGLFTTAEAAINNYHDARMTRVLQGENPGPSLFANGVADVDEDSYAAFANTIGNRVSGAFTESNTNPGAPRRPSEPGDVPVFAAHTPTSELANLPDEVKAMAINMDDPVKAAEAVAKANRDNVAVLAIKNGQLGLIRPRLGQ